MRLCLLSYIGAWLFAIPMEVAAHQIKVNLFRNFDEAFSKSVLNF
jgi:hypothetical protein